MFSWILLRSLWYDRWINTAVMFGVLCASAVLTGALFVGDSMRGSLKALTLDRLGNIDTILFAPHFINPPLPKGEGIILLPAAVEFNGKVCGVQLLGRIPHPNPLPEGEGTKTVANQALADAVGLQSGDTLSLRFLSPQSIPPESSLGRKDQLLRTRISVDDIIPNRGIGHFSLKMDQQAEPLLIVPLDWLQQRLDVGKKVNAVFFFNDSPPTFEPTFEDLGIAIEHHDGKCYIKSAQMLFTDAQVEAIRNSLAGTPASEGLLYLATSIRAVKNDREIPYSTVYATNIYESRERNEVERPDQPGEQSGHYAALRPRLSLDEIVLNRWTADNLDVQIGDEIELTWFDPHNTAITHSKTFTLAAILPMDGLGGDPQLVPNVKGFTDEASIADWDPPFPFDAKRIRKVDENYWNEYRAAPKAFVSLATGQELWGSRFGKITTFVTEPQSLDCETLRNLKIAALFNITFVPVKAQGLAASAGTTPFSVLFLAFSFFIIASALMLVMMLFRLSVEMKAKRIGILLSVGWTTRQVTWSLLSEGFLLSLLGSFVGALLGIFYAWLMVYGLTTWWIDAVSVSFLTLRINPISLFIGFASGAGLAMLTIIWSVRGITKVPLRSLLHGEIKGRRPTSTDATQRSSRITKRELTNHLILCFIMTMLVALPASRTNHPVWFFCIGTVVLVAGISHYRLRLRGTTNIETPLKFAQSSIARNPSRSLLCVALVASTTFLVLSISAFHLDSSKKGTQGPSGGNIGYSFMGETMFPVLHDIGTPDGREQLAIQPDDEKYLQELRFRDIKMFYKSLRMKSGDSVSCLNLYQSENPRILGLPEAMFGMYRRHIWLPLWQPITIDPDGVRRVPVILDQNTAMYALHLYGGIGDVYEYDDGPNGIIRCEVVGLLKNSILQGEILMSEENFLTLFPEVNGYQFFLFGSFMGDDMYPLDARTLRIIYDLLGDYGFQGEPTADRLRKLFAVQNTYLSTFQSLGGIGLLLGIFGLAVIQSRNVLERRKELALLQAVGFTKCRTILLLLYESFTLLAWGLGLAVVASTFALLPFLLGGVEQISPMSVLRQFIVLVGSLLAVGIVSNVAAALAVLKIPVARELAEER